MKVGCHLPVYGAVATRANLLAFARRIEDLGFGSLWASDHVVIPFEIRSRYPYGESGEFPLSPTTSFLEPLTALALVAGVTERVALGTSILVLPHRNPVLAAKTIATLDHLAGGRVILGVGVGWMREEVTVLGAPFERRGAWSDEAIQAMRACWTEERSTFHGQFFDFDALGVFPKPARGNIPIWIGGHTPGALRRTARFGDGWHAAFAPPKRLEEDLGRLRTECRAAGRRFEDLVISLRTGLSVKKSSVETRDDLQRYRDLGVQHVLLETRYRDFEEMIALYERVAAEVLPKI
jgi:probable F420-dependent oxidoreductase